MTLNRREALSRLAPKEVVLHEGAETSAGEKVFQLNPPRKSEVVFCLFLDVGTTVAITIINHDEKSGKDEAAAIVDFGTPSADATVWKYPADFTTDKVLSNAIKITWDKACTFTLTAHV